jgi:hypothetical protein
VTVRSSLGFALFFDFLVSFAVALGSFGVVNLSFGVVLGVLLGYNRLCQQNSIAKS